MIAINFKLTRRFFRYVRVQDGHWIWTGELNRNGYGYLTVQKDGQRRKVMAHRLSYEINFGRIHYRHVVDHGCRIRRCVHPLHLEPVTGKVNTLRGEGPTAQAARQTHCLRGHAFDRKSTYIRRDGRGRRACRTCARARKKESYAAQKVATA